MKRRLATLPILFALMLVLAGCGGGTVLTGSWQDENGNIYQFSKADALVIADKANTTSMSCKYELTPDEDDSKSLTGRIKITITPAEGKRTEKEATYKIEEDSGKVTITGDDGSVSVLTK